MKRFLTLFVISVFALPSFASCSLDSNEPCTATILDGSPSLQEKLVPNHIEEISKTDAFQPQYKQPYYDALINTTPATQSHESSSNYNSNCQFGVCLPGVGPAQGEFID